MMAVNNNSSAGGDDDAEQHSDDVYEKLVALHRKVLRHKDVTLPEIEEICKVRDPILVRTFKEHEDPRTGSLWSPVALITLAILVAGAALATSLFTEDSVLERLVWESRCALQNNFLVMEATRPETDCRMCVGVSSVVELAAQTVTREEFARLAYASQPVLVRGATANWTAMTVFGFDFFREIYERTQGAYEAVEQECQFFPFNTDFTSLRQVFAMSPARAHFEPEEASWYIGWSNCDPRVAAQLRSHYQRPSFLPEHADTSAIDWIFMGGPGPGASLHLDYVSRRSWQAQVSGSKTWRLVPPPECEHVCSGFSVVVNTGDIVLIDTNQWYHDTYVNPGPVSITIGSEYG